MKDVTIVEKNNNGWVVRLNTYSRPYGLSIPMSSNKDVKIEPGVTYDKEGRMIVSKDEKPLLVPAKLYIPGNYTYEQVLDIISDVKKKEEKCPICQTIKKEVKSGNVTWAGEDAEPLLTPDEAEKLLKKKYGGDEINKDENVVKTKKSSSREIDNGGNSNINLDAVENQQSEVKVRKKAQRKKHDKPENNIANKTTGDEIRPLIIRFPLLEKMRPKRWFE